MSEALYEAKLEDGDLLINAWCVVGGDPFRDGTVLHPSGYGEEAIGAQWTVAGLMEPGLTVLSGIWTLGNALWPGRSKLTLELEQSGNIVSQSFKVISGGENDIGLSFISDGSPCKITLSLELRSDDLISSALAISGLTYSKPVQEDSPTLYDLSAITRRDDDVVVNDRALIAANQGGLINRLVPLLSTIYVAERSGAKPYAVWAPNAHCAASFGDIFDRSAGEFMPADPNFMAPSLRLFDNYLDPDLVLRLDSLEKNTVIHSISPIVTHPNFPHSEQQLGPIFRRLTLAPKIREMLSAFDEIDLSKTIALHIRRPYPSGAFAELEKSKFTLGLDIFIDLIRDAREAFPNYERVLLCTNDLNAEQELRESLGGDIISFRKTTTDNTSEPVAVQEAVVDLLLMSKCPVLFSQESTSFGRFAHVLSERPMYCLTASSTPKMYSFWRFEAGRHVQTLRVPRREPDELKLRVPLPNA